MFDLYAIESSRIHSEMINRMAAESATMACSLTRTPRPTLRQRVLDGLGSLLIETGIRLKSQALVQPERASSPSWLITL